MGRSTTENVDLVVSVVIVSDVENDAQRSWRTERSPLEALARQDFREPFEVVLVESERYRDEAPWDLAKMCPRLRIVYSAETQSAKLKDFGVSWAKSELSRSWRSSMRIAFRTNRGCGSWWTSFANGPKCRP